MKSFTDQIRISVTGHMDIDADTERNIKERFRTFLEGMVVDNAGKEIFILCGMAEGSDIAAAEAVLESENVNMHIVPVLTNGVMRRRDENALFRERFDRIMDDTSTEEPHHIKGDDEGQYVRLSRFLIEESQIMVAFWDGRLYRNRGGTFDTITMAVKDIPVYWIKTERTSLEQELRGRGYSGESVDYSDLNFLVPGSAVNDEMSAERKKLAKELNCHFESGITL